MSAAAAAAAAMPADASVVNPLIQKAEIPIPIIDIGPFVRGEAGRMAVVDEVRNACEKAGFFSIVNHGVDHTVIDAAWQAVRDFFDMPESDKNEVPMTSDYPYGYTGIGQEVLSRSLDQYGVADLKETFQMCLGPVDRAHPEMPVPRWPSKPAHFRDAYTGYYRAMEGLANTLLRIFALALRLPENWFEDKTNEHWCSLRALNYPHQDKAPAPGQLRASAHTDYGSLTILRQGGDAPGGLQVQKSDSEWMDVPAHPDAFVINLGDLMQRWTNDKWRSTMHRVINPAPDAAGSTRRQSMAFFHNINRDVVVSCIETCADEGVPPRYPPITAGEHLMLKHAAAMAMKAFQAKSA